MGAFSSKATRPSTAARRKYPTRIPPAARRQDASPALRPTAQACSSGTNANLDGQNPSYAASLRALGPVTPPAFPARSSSSVKQVFPDPAQNPAVRLLEARRALAARAERELEGLGRPGAAGGREFLDVNVVKEILLLRDAGVDGGEIERQMGLKPGVVKRLGGKEVVAMMASAGPVDVDI